MGQAVKTHPSYTPDRIVLTASVRSDPGTDASKPLLLSRCVVSGQLLFTRRNSPCRFASASIALCASLFSATHPKPASLQ